jgi:hypothetical protein
MCLNFSQDTVVSAGKEGRFQMLARFHVKSNAPAAVWIFHCLSHLLLAGCSTVQHAMRSVGSQGERCHTLCRDIMEKS